MRFLTTGLDSTAASYQNGVRTAEGRGGVGSGVAFSGSGLVVTGADRTAGLPGVTRLMERKRKRN